MTAATHNGTCQVCGRVHARTERGLALHGYTVEWHCYNGTCRGSRRPPIEESTELLDSTVAACLKDAEWLDSVSTYEQIEAMVAPTVRASFRVGSPYSGKLRKIVFQSEDALRLWLCTSPDAPHFERSYRGCDNGPRGYWGYLIRRQADENKSTAADLRFHAKVLTELKELRAGKPLFPRGVRR